MQLLSKALIKQEIEIIKYDVEKGIQFNWEKNFAIKVKNEGNEV